MSFKVGDRFYITHERTHGPCWIVAPAQEEKVITYPKGSIFSVTRIDGRYIGAACNTVGCTVWFFDKDIRHALIKLK